MPYIPPPQQVHLVPIRYFGSLSALVSRLQTNDPTLNTASPIFLYRGVPQRYIRVWPPRQETNYAKNYIKTDSLIDSAYRGLERHYRTHPNRPVPARLTDSATWLRAIVTLDQLSALRHDLQHMPQIQAWFQMIQQPGSPTIDWATALGEHCGVFPTHHLNLTCDWQVALWFATHRFCGSTIPGQRRGVIYRFCQDRFSQAVADTNQSRGAQFPDAMCILNLCDVPPEIAKRPSAQRGWTLTYPQPPWLVPNLLSYTAVELFSFPIDPSYPHLCTQQIRPTGDEIADRIEIAVAAGWSSLPQCVFNHYNALRPCNGGLTYGDVALWQAAFERP